MVFWTFLYPIILAIFFGLAFSNLSAADSFQSFPVAVVDNAAYRSDTAFQEALRSVSSDAADTKLFDLAEMTEEQAAAGLRDGILAGYILLEDGAQVFVRESGLRQTILKSFVDSYLQTSSAYYTVLAEDPSKLASITAPGELVFPSEQSPNDKAADSSLINFFALISMAVLFGGFLGKKEVDDIQANLSDLGARVNLAPVPKLQVFAYSMSAALLVQALSLLLLMGFLALALGVEFGGQLGYILLACFVGSAMGISYGALIGTFFKGGKGMAVLITVSLLLSSAAGLQAPSLKYIIVHNVPILAYLNPANLITDAFYSLYYYTSMTRYFANIGLLAAFAAVFFTVVVFVTGRRKYASL
jgi:ABC-2 type transport system permease protein